MENEFNPDEGCEKGQGSTDPKVKNLSRRATELGLRQINAYVEIDAQEFEKNPLDDRLEKDRRRKKHVRELKKDSGKTQFIRFVLISQHQSLGELTNRLDKSGDWLTAVMADPVVLEKTCKLSQELKVTQDAVTNAEKLFAEAIASSAKAQTELERLKPFAPQAEKAMERIDHLEFVELEMSRINRPHGLTRLFLWMAGIVPLRKKDEKDPDH